MGVYAGFPSGFSFPTEGTRVSQGTSPHGAALSRGGTVQSVYSCFSYLPIAFCLGLNDDKGVFQPHPYRSLSDTLFLNKNKLLVVFLVRGSKVKNNLYRHLSDVSPLLYFFTTLCLS